MKYEGSLTSAFGLHTSDFYIKPGPMVQISMDKTTIMLIKIQTMRMMLCFFIVILID